MIVYHMQLACGLKRNVNEKITLVIMRWELLIYNCAFYSKNLDFKNNCTGNIY